MATDRVLIDATNQTFWDLTNYKPGQRLDMSNPQDAQMAKRWNEIYKQIGEYRIRAWNRANEVLEASMDPGRTVQPYVLIIERSDGSFVPQVFPSRANLDVMFDWITDQIDRYTYAAAFDFTQKTDGPIADAFAAVKRRQVSTVSGLDNVASDRVLIDAANEAFWQVTEYKRGQRLDMTNPQDREMAKTWLKIYRQLEAHRTHATHAAQSLSTERKIPYIVVAEQRQHPTESGSPFGNLQTTAFETRNAMEAQYQWALDQTDRYAYLAAFDFTVDPNGPVHDQFAVVHKLRSETMTSGWYRGY